MIKGFNACPLKPPLGCLIPVIDAGFMQDVDDATFNYLKKWISDQDRGGGMPGRSQAPFGKQRAVPADFPVRAKPAAFHAPKMTIDLATKSRLSVKIIVYAGMRWVRKLSYDAASADFSGLDFDIRHFPQTNSQEDCDGINACIRCSYPFSFLASFL